MAVHLIRLAVGVESVSHLAELFQPRRFPYHGRIAVATVTRRTPRRVTELCDGGSLYWVIKGIVSVRQPIWGIDAAADDDGKPLCRLILGGDLVPTQMTPRRPFQGWRYLDAASAPPDAAAGGRGDQMPSDLLRELRDLGLA